MHQFGYMNSANDDKQPVFLALGKTLSMRAKVLPKKQDTRDGVLFHLLTAHIVN